MTKIADIIRPYSPTEADIREAWDGRRRPALIVPPMTTRSTFNVRFAVLIVAMILAGAFIVLAASVAAASPSYQVLATDWHSNPPSVAVIDGDGMTAEDCGRALDAFVNGRRIAFGEDGRILLDVVYSCEAGPSE